jgi:hypothetical protein
MSGPVCQIRGGAPALSSREFFVAVVAIARRWSPEKTAMELEETFLVDVTRRDCLADDLCIDNKSDSLGSLSCGIATIFDLAHDSVAGIHCSSGCLSFYLPRPSLEQIANEVSERRVRHARRPSALAPEQLGRRGRDRRAKAAVASRRSATRPAGSSRSRTWSRSLSPPPDRSQTERYPSSRDE